MTIRQLIDHFLGDTIVHAPAAFYASMEWWTDFVNPNAEKIKEYMRLWEGNRELMETITDQEWDSGLGPVWPAGSWEAVSIWTDKYIDAMLSRNAYKYKRLYDLYLADFNPLWNVEGEEKITFDWNMNRTGKDTNTRSGEDKNVASGTDTSTNSTTTYDSSLDHPTDKNTLQHGRTDTRTYTNLKDEREYTNLKDTKSGTETKTRGGNIGVTKSTELAEDALNWAGMFKFIEIIAQDAANEISYYF